MRSEKKLYFYLMNGVESKVILSVCVFERHVMLDCLAGIVLESYMLINSLSRSRSANIIVFLF